MSEAGPIGQATVFAVAAVGGADEVALTMLRHLARTAGVGVSAPDGPLTPGERGLGPDAAEATVLIASVRPGGLTEVRYLCRRIRNQCPGAKIIVGWWGGAKGAEKARTLLLAAGADRVAVTLQEACTHLVRLAQPLLPASGTA